MAELLHVQVCYALPNQTRLVDIDLAEGSTLEQAIRASGVLVQYPEIDLASVSVGVFGKLRRMSDLARAGDRIEIYRPLIADPKESRRRRAQHKARAADKG